MASAAALSLVASGAPTLVAHAAGSPSAQTAVVSGARLSTALAAKPSAKPDAAFNKIKITWKGAKKSTKIWVYGSDGYTGLLKASTRFKATAKRTGATTAVVTVPAKYKARIGGNTGRLVYLYVFAKNGGATKKSPMLVSMAGVKKAKGTAKQQLRIATYNVASVNATKSLRGQAWSKRRISVVNAITKANPDVLAVQEASMSKTSAGIFQSMDLKALLAKKGYAMNVDLDQIYDAWQGRIHDRQLTCYLFYKTSTVKLLDTGMRSSGGGAPIDRFYSWGKFQSLKSGKVFYAASVHLETGGTAKTIAYRTKQINNWTAFMAKKAGKAPVFMAGDYNTDFRAEKMSATQRQVAKGWQDAAATYKRTGFQYGSTNDKPTSYQGFAPKPSKDPLGQGGKIDHIMSKNTSGVFKYVNQVVLKGGKFVESYRGSDHNLQWAIIGLA